MPTIIHGTGGQIFINGEPIGNVQGWEADISPTLPDGREWLGPYVSCRFITLTLDWFNLRALKRNNIMAKKICRMARRMRLHRLN